MPENTATENLDDLNGRFLTFYIGAAIYGLELLHVIEIIKIQGITKIPNVPCYIKGIINLRGKIVPVIDVRVKFGQEEKEPDEKTCIIVVDIESMHVGLVVDSVSEVVSVDKSDLASPPSFSSNENNKYLQSVANLQDRIVLNIDCSRFFQSDLTATGFTR